MQLQSASVTATAACYTNTMAATPNSPTTGTGSRVYIFYVYVGTACQNITINFSGSVTGDAMAGEYPGAPSSGALDIDCGSSGNGTSLSSGSCVTTNASDLLFGAGMSMANSITYTAGSGYTREVQESHSSQGNSAFIEDQNVVAAGSNSATATASGSAANWVMMMAAFKVAPPAPTISPLDPIVSAGGTQAFSCSADCGTGGSWAVLSGLGSIDSGTGVFTAPAAATTAACQSIVGFQLLPCDHIFNTDISGLSAASNSATIMSGLGSTAISFLPAYPINYVNNATHTESMVFFYSSDKDGTFTVPQWPDAKVENGWFDARSGNTNADHHVLSCNYQSGVCSEMYQYYPAGSNGTCPLCTSQSGVQYNYSDYELPNGSTTAAGTYIMPLNLRSQEFVNAVVAGSTINHAMHMTLTNGHLCNSSIANACVVGSTGNLSGTRHIWPASAESYSGGGTVPYGACFRLKASYDISSFSAPAQIILTEMKHYCLFATDGGIDFQISIDYDNLPVAEVAALKEINAAGIVGSASLEAVDTGSLMESFDSGAVNTGNIICYTSSTGTACTHVDLQGTAVNVDTNQEYFMAGTPQTQLVYYSNGAVTCSMSPSVGSLTSDCKYTPPASISAGTLDTTTVTFTSSVDSSVTAQTIVYSFPADNFNITQDTSDFTDSHGKKWFAGGGYGFGISNAPQWQGCCQNDASITGTDKEIQWNHFYSSSTHGDLKMDFHVPDGIYTVTQNNGTTLASGADVRYFYSQGVLANTIDSTAAVGLNKFWTYASDITVSGGVLSIYNAGIGNQGNTNTGDISSVSVLFSGSPPAPTGTAIPAGVTIRGVVVH